jgi:hypothetical protein
MKPYTEVYSTYLLPFNDALLSQNNATAIYKEALADEKKKAIEHFTVDNIPNVSKMILESMRTKYIKEIERALLFQAREQMERSVIHSETAKNVWNSRPDEGGIN